MADRRMVVLEEASDFTPEQGEYILRRRRDEVENDLRHARLRRDQWQCEVERLKRKVERTSDEIDGIARRNMSK